MSWHFASLLCDGFYYIVKWNKKVKGYNKTKSCKPFWYVKCWKFYICIYRWIYSQHNYPKIYATLKTKMKQIWQLHLPLNMTNSNSYCFLQQTWYSLIYSWTWYVLNFKINLNDITSKSHIHTCTHPTKYLHCEKFYKCNSYEYIKHNLLSMSGISFRT
jgi:hypothetical protein